MAICQKILTNTTTVLLCLIDLNLKEVFNLPSLISVKLDMMKLRREVFDTLFVAAFSLVIFSLMIR